MKGMNTYQRRIVLYLLGVVLFIPITWKLGFKRTLELKQQQQSINQKLELVTTAPERINIIRKRLEHIDKLVINSDNETQLQNRVLTEISMICRKKGLLLHHMPPMYKEVDNNYLMETTSVAIAGNFHKLLGLLHTLEDPKKNLNIVSSEFYTEEDKKTKQRKLFLKLYIQTLKNK
jgi:Tfp pilus assembly protein PilO